MSKVFVIGGGAAGMMAGYFAAANGHETILIEQNEKLGKKIFITGKGRCNITNGGEISAHMEAVTQNPRFLYSAYQSFESRDMMEFMEEAGCPIKTERGNRVFPLSDHSSDVIRGLEKKLRQVGVKICFNTKVTDILVKDHEFHGVCVKQKGKKETWTGDVCIIATGGKSYPLTGSTGDGYIFAEKLGHKVTHIMPSLVPMNVKEDYIRRMQGLSLKNVTLSFKKEGKSVFHEQGEMLFTHFGVSGPLIIKASALVGPLLYPKGNFSGEEKAEGTLEGKIDLKPALSEKQLDERILRDFEKNKNKQFKTILSGLLPQKMIPIMVELSDISEEKKIHGISKEERLRLVHLMKAFPFTVHSLRSFKEAIVTKGGVDVQEISPSTMESKMVKRVFFAGEILDLDAFTGGYNLQIAWSTGAKAGNSIPWI